VARCCQSIRTQMLVLVEASCVQQGRASVPAVRIGSWLNSSWAETCDCSIALSMTATQSIMYSGSEKRIDSSQCWYRPVEMQYLYIQSSCGMGACRVLPSRSTVAHLVRCSYSIVIAPRGAITILTAHSALWCSVNQMEAYRNSRRGTEEVRKVHGKP